MKKCSEDCPPICDFCRMYNFNPKTIDGEKGIYVYHGYCVWHEERRDPDDECDDFICSHYKKEDDVFEQ